jgi:hypothetical protein
MGQMRKPATGMWTFFETSCCGGVPVGESQHRAPGQCQDMTFMLCAWGTTQRR